MGSLAGEPVPAPFFPQTFKECKLRSSFDREEGSTACLSQAGEAAAEALASPHCVRRNQSPKCPPRGGSKLNSGKRNVRRHSLRLPDIRVKFAFRRDRPSSKPASRAHQA